MGEELLGKYIPQDTGILVHPILIEAKNLIVNDREAKSREVDLLDRRSVALAPT